MLVNDQMVGSVDNPGLGKHVLVIVENLPVPLDRRVWQESCALRDAGYEVSVICPRMRGYNEPYEELEGISIYRHWISGEASGIGGFVTEYVSALVGEFICAWKVRRRRKVDIVHLCNPPDILFVVALPFKLFGAKVLFDVHDLWPEMFEAKFGKRGMLYWAVRLAERCTLAVANSVIATNESVLKAVQLRGKKRDEEVMVVRTSPNAIDTNVASDPSFRKGRRYLVGYIGVMGNADGIDYLLGAVRHIVHNQKRSDISFLLMGTGPEWEDLNKMREDYAIGEYVEMPGRVSDEFLSTALQTMDLGVSCDPINSYNDHCTMNKVLEYMAFEKPQVMFDLVEGRYSAGDAAVYVDENSSEKLGEAIVDLLDDPEKCAELGKKGYQRLSENLSWERSVRALRGIYETL